MNKTDLKPKHSLKPLFHQMLIILAARQTLKYSNYPNKIIVMGLQKDPYISLKKKSGDLSDFF